MHRIKIDEYELYPLMTKLARQKKPVSYLEIGVREGDSLLALIEGHHPEEVVLVDNWTTAYGGTGRGDHGHIEPLLRSSDYRGHIEYRDGDSKEILPEMIESHQDHFDIILVDGDHSAEGISEDLQCAWMLVKENGVVVVDDLVHPEHKYVAGIVKEFIDSTENAEIAMWSTADGHGVCVIWKVPAADVESQKQAVAGIVKKASDVVDIFSDSCSSMINAQQEE